MRNLAPVTVLAASAWLVSGCAGTAAKPNAAAPVVVVGEGAKREAAPKAAAAKKTDPNAQREKLIAELSNKGILGVLGSSDGKNGAFGDVWGSIDADDAAVFGGLTGGVVGGAVGGIGVGGLGLRGTGGGGGTGSGTIGIGGIGKAGHGYGYGYGSRPRGRPKAKIETATVKGALTPQVVQRILSDHRDDVQDCYLLEIARATPPRGKITLAFTIDDTGRVNEVSIPETTFWSHDLPSCVAQVVGTFRFPAPPKDETVKVLLPISF